MQRFLLGGVSLVHRSFNMSSHMNFISLLGFLLLTSTYGYVIEYRSDAIIPQRNFSQLEKIILASLQTENRNQPYQKRNIANLDFTVGSGYLHQRNYLMFQKMLQALNAGNNPTGR
eukprot:XP_011449451.1 PREDICTED: uncharacterized protein LOC105343672 [Crassostrea gigas]